MNILIIHGWNPDGVVSPEEVAIYQGLADTLRFEGHNVILPWLPFPGTAAGDVKRNADWLNSSGLLDQIDVIIGHSEGGLVAEWILRFLSNDCTQYVSIDSKIHTPHGTRWWEAGYYFGPVDQRENSVVWQSIINAPRPSQALLDVWCTQDCSAYPHDVWSYQPLQSHTSIVSSEATRQAVISFLQS